MTPCAREKCQKSCNGKYCSRSCQSKAMHEEGRAVLATDSYKSKRYIDTMRVRRLRAGVEDQPKDGV